MDLSALKISAAGAEMPVLHPVTGDALTNDKGDAMTITLVGTDSVEFKSIVRDRLRKQPASKAKQVDLEEAEQRGIELLAKITQGWSGIQFEGKPLAFSYENAVKLYSELPWLKEQVDKFVADRSNFIKS